MAEGCNGSTYFCVNDIVKVWSHRSWCQLLSRVPGIEISCTYWDFSLVYITDQLIRVTWTPASKTVVCIMCIETFSPEVIKSRFKLQMSKIPAYFTEYCRKSYDLTRLQMNIVNKQLDSASSSVHVSEPTINPFRSPIRKHNLLTAVPAFSNAVIFHLEYRCC